MTALAMHANDDRQHAKVSPQPWDQRMNLAQFFTEPT